MVDFNRIAAEQFEMNIQVLKNKPNDAVARSYMIGVMMAKHLTDEHIQMAKRCVIE
tara:strand:+ start:19944 stop:20111 length:168 start_codon:yes stop_codon:yes gene_type:complete